jgi:hypothetical protein
MGQQRRNDPAKSRSHWEKGKGEKYVETFTITTEYRIVQQNTSLASIETRTTKILHVCAHLSVDFVIRPGLRPCAWLLHIYQARFVTE